MATWQHWYFDHWVTVPAGEAAYVLCVRKGSVRLV